MRRFAALLVASLAAPLIAMAGPAGTGFAQEVAAPPQSDIVVEAPRSLPAPEMVGRSSYTGAPVVVMTLRIPVLYGDLDLADPVDADRLMTRVGRVAQDACDELDRLYPLTADPDCAATTMKLARPLAEARIAAAKRPGS